MTAVSHKKELAALKRSPPDDYRDHYLLPKVKDLFSSPAAPLFLRPNIIQNCYPSVEVYNDIQFRLLQHDFMEPFRETIGKFCSGRLEKDKLEHLKLWSGVTFFVGSFLEGVTVPDRPDNWRRYTIRFHSPKGFDFEKNKRLIHGSLVVLWNHKKKLAIIATVAHSDPEELEKGKMMIIIQNEPDGDFIQLEYVMIECDTFFEPYRVVLEAYQNLNEENLPLKPVILGWKKTPGVPDYLQKKSNYKLGQFTVKDALNLNSWPKAEELGVNPIQREALHAALTRKVALIQGPPGTGKTFIGRKIIAHLLDNKLMWQGDHSGNEAANARLLDLYAKKGKMKNFWDRFGDQWRDDRTPIFVICLTNQALDQFMEGLLSSTTRMIRIGGQSKSSKLESYTMSVTKETIHQDYKKYKQTAFLYYCGQMRAVKKDFDCIAEELKRKKRKGIIKFTDRLESNLKGKIVEYNELRAKAEEALCRNVDVIGLTTTGAARRRTLLQLLRPKIVVVEEAAQVLECHIVASLTPSVEHLIMIGDHQQLRPQCNVHLLAQKYQMDVSLFERLVRRKMPSVMLSVQHRMRPEICRLIVPSVYNQLTNHESVLARPAVPSMSRNVFFLDHSEPEGQEENGTSYFNMHEVQMACRLAHFLTDQNVQQEHITILVTYAAQLRKVEAHRKEFYKLRSLDHVHVTTVDNYQGEENDVIILSLVRNNRQGSVGFLRTANRVCVALSRARNGLFILGNIRLMSQSGSKLWQHVQKVLTVHGEVGQQIIFRCDRHPNEKGKKAKVPGDFPLGGIVCGQLCGVPLEVCGHPCPLPCYNQCHHTPAQCNYPVQHPSSCGHKVKKKPCFDKRDVACTARCIKKMECGHRCLSLCSEPCKPDECAILVRLLHVQPCGHALFGPCHLRLKSIEESKKILDQNGPLQCNEPCGKVLLCGHTCPAKCGQPCPPCHQPCQFRCQHQTCNRVCGEECTLCQNRCEWKCGHNKCDHPCFEFCERKPCQSIHPCPVQELKCGHPCAGLCGEICPPSCPPCLGLLKNTRYYYLPDCGHYVPLEEMDRWIKPDKIVYELKPPKCPKCSDVIRFNHGRYGDYIKAFYEDLYVVRLSIFASKLKQHFSFVSHDNKKSVTVQLKAHWVAELLKKFKASPDVAEADLFFQLRTMQSIQQPSHASKAVHKLLKQAGEFLKVRRYVEAAPVLKSASDLLGIDWSSPADSDKWYKCSDCDSVFPSVNNNVVTCSNTECGLVASVRILTV